MGDEGAGEREEAEGGDREQEAEGGAEANGSGEDEGADGGAGDGGAAEESEGGGVWADGVEEAGTGQGEDDRENGNGGEGLPEQESEPPTPDDIGEAVREGWCVGVCGVQCTRTWRRSEGEAEGAEYGSGIVGEGVSVVCDFITEFIAPGIGYGQRGAGLRLLGEVYAHMLQGYGERDYVGKGVRSGEEGQECEEGREVHGYVGKGNDAIKWWEARGMYTVWGCEDPEGWWDGTGMTRRVYRTDEPDDTGYMRSTWKRVNTVMDSPALTEKGERAVKWYDTIEALRADKEIYKAVRAVIRATHVKDGMTVWDIMKETEEQKRQGRIGYMVVAERAEGNGKEEAAERRSRGGEEGRHRRQAVDACIRVMGGASSEEVRGEEGEDRGAPASQQPREGKARTIALSRAGLSVQAEIRMSRVREAAAKLGLQLRDNLMGATREEICTRERWGREPIEGGGWLVLFAHGQLGEGKDTWSGCVMEIRLAVLQAQ